MSAAGIERSSRPLRTTSVCAAANAFAIPPQLMRCETGEIDRKRAAGAALEVGEIDGSAEPDGVVGMGNLGKGDALPRGVVADAHLHVFDENVGSHREDKGKYSGTPASSPADP